MASRDIETLLEKGSWTRSRARGVNTSDSRPRANQSSKLERVSPDSYHHIGFDKDRFPPPPSVEDEVESLAKEYCGTTPGSTLSDEEAPCRGDIEQTPIILPNPHHNPERRFVLVPNDIKDGDINSPGSESNNPCQKFVHLSLDGNANEKAEGKRPSRPAATRRRSNSEVPMIKTDTAKISSLKSPNSSERRRRRGVTIDQERRTPADHSERRQDSKHSDGRSTPVMQYASSGREKAYHDFRQASTKSSMPQSPSGRESKDSRVNSSDRRSAHSRTSRSPTGSLRQQSLVGEASKYEQSSERRSRRPADREQRYISERDRHGPWSARATSPPRNHVPSRSSSYRRNRDSPARDNGEYSSRSDTRRSQSRRTTVSHDERPPPYYAEPPEAANGRSKTRVNTPLASPRLSDAGHVPDTEPGHFGHSPRSATFPPERFSQKKEGLPYPTSERSMDTSGSRVDMPSPMPVRAMSAGSSSTVEKHSKTDAYDVENERHAANRLIKSYRRYTEDVRKGLMTSLPDCARSSPKYGYNDWRTIPRYENFHICPGCYENVFARSTFQHAFIPTHQPPDKAIACDFGFSIWYRIAFVMTLKYEYTDLRLLAGIAAVAARHQPCLGQHSAMRIWYSLIDPHAQRPIPGFLACHGCAKTVEVLLPNLVGAFVPLHSASEPTKGVCELRYMADRKRFLDYFDLMEMASDRALSRQSAPDLQLLADRVRALTLIPECRRSVPCKDHKWHVLKALPDLTVCEECYDEVVWPLIEAENGGHGTGEGSNTHDFVGGIAKWWSFQQRPGLAACQLYSDRMRDVFREACRRNDFEYFEDKLNQRLDREALMRARIKKLRSDFEKAQDPRLRDEIHHEIAWVLDEWKRWE